MCAGLRCLYGPVRGLSAEITDSFLFSYFFRHFQAFSLQLVFLVISLFFPPSFVAVVSHILPEVYFPVDQSSRRTRHRCIFRIHTFVKKFLADCTFSDMESAMCVRAMRAQSGVCSLSNKKISVFNSYCGEAYGFTNLVTDAVLI